MSGRTLIVTASLAIALVAASASAQDTKADADVEPEGRLKAMARRMGSLTSPSQDKDGGVSVSAGIIVAGSNLAAGLGYRRMNVFRNIDVEVEGTMSVRWYQEYRAAIGLLDTRASTLGFDVADRKIASLFNVSSRKAVGSAVFVDIRYRHYPRHTYYGTGIDALEENRADYALRGPSVEGVWQWQLSPTFGLSARGGWLDLEFGPGHNDRILNLEDRFDLAAIPGALEQPLYFTYGAGVAHDTRSEPGAPADGRLIGVSLRRFSASNRPELSFTRATLDARGYQRVTAGGVIAVRGLMSADFTGETGATPFYLLQSLGGGETLRGFHSYRFPHQALAHGAAEYRWRAHRFVEIAPFVDAGTVASGLSRLSMGSVKVAPGIGIRARNDRHVIARLDWARSAEGHRIVLGVGPAF